MLEALELAYDGPLPPSVLARWRARCIEAYASRPAAPSADTRRPDPDH